MNSSDMALYLAVFTLFLLGLIVSRVVTRFVMDKIGYDWTTKKVSEYIRHCLNEQKELDETICDRGASLSMMARYMVVILTCSMIAIVFVLISLVVVISMRFVFIYAAALGVLLGCIISLIREWLCDVYVARLKQIHDDDLYFQDVLNDGKDGEIVANQDIFGDASALNIGDAVLFVELTSDYVFTCKV